MHKPRLPLASVPFVRAGLFLATAIAFTGCDTDGAPTIEPIPPLTCQDLACEEDHRTCTESNGSQGATCGDCTAGHIEKQGLCERIAACEQSPEVCGEGTCINEDASYRCDCAPSYQDLGEGCERFVDQIAVGNAHPAPSTKENSIVGDTTNAGNSEAGTPRPYPRQHPLSSPKRRNTSAHRARTLLNHPAGHARVDGEASGTCPRRCLRAPFDTRVTASAQPLGRRGVELVH